MIVDSSAIVAIVCNERDGSNFLSKLANSVEPLRISAASYLECAIVIDRLKDPILNSRLDELLEQLGVVIGRRKFRPHCLGYASNVRN